jgi:hypothetical protein
MKNKYSFIFLLLIFLIQGCAETFYTYDIENSGDIFASEPAILPQGQFFVSNKDLSFEYLIFKQSGLFNESETENNAITVLLQPIQRADVCGNPILGSMLLLGTVPIKLPHDAKYSFSISKEGKTKIFYFNLRSYSRYSIWEWFFKPFNSEAEAYAKALLMAKPNQVK